MIFENISKLNKHEKMMMNTSEIADRLARIENLILGLNKDALPLDGCVKKMPASRPEVEPQTQVCKVSYDILAINIKNKLQKLFQTKELEVTWLEEIDFEEMILSSLNPIECNELITGSQEQVGLQNWTRCDTTVEKSSGMSVVNNDDENSQSSTTTTTKPTKSKKTTNTSQAIDKETMKAEKEAKANEKKSEKQELVLMKAYDKESKEYETSIKKMEKATAPKPTETAAQKKKAEKEAKELEKKAEKEANELKKKAEKEAKELEKKAEKEANELKKKAEKENKAPRKRTKDATASQSLVSQSQPTIELFHDDEVSNSKSSTTDAVELSPSPPPPQTQIQPKLSLIKPSEYNKIEEKSEKINEENAAEEEEEENSTNTEDEAEDDEEETKPTHEILTNWSIPSKPEILYFVKKGTYIYECVKNEENPKGEINWNNSVGLVMGSKIVYTMSYKHYESLIVRT